MTSPRPASSLARRFALAAAALAVASVLLTVLSSWWLIHQQQVAAARLLAEHEARDAALMVETTLGAVRERVVEVAGSSIIATALVDSVGKETYLMPYLGGIRRINGVPFDLVFTDFAGQFVASNNSGEFDNRHRAWLMERLASSSEDAVIMEGPEGPELVAVELLRHARTKTPEGALLYKLPLGQLVAEPRVNLTWDEPRQENERVVSAPVAAPEPYADLRFRVQRRIDAVAASALAPHYLVLLLMAALLAAGVCLLGWRLAVALTRDLRALETFAKSVVESGFGEPRAPVAGSSEVAGLARSINHMLDRLHNQHLRLQEESRQLQRLADSIPQLAWMADPDGYTHWYNQRWYEYTGASPEQMLGWGWQSVQHPQHLAETLRVWRASLATGEPFECTFPMRGADGRYRTFFTRAAPLRDSAGNIVQWFGTNTDVTPLEEAEMAVRESEERLRQGLKAGRMVVWDWDLALDRISLSENAPELLGQSVNTDSRLWGAVHDEDASVLDQALRSAIDTGVGKQCLVRMRSPRNESFIWVEVRIQALQARGATSALRGILLDVTERKRAEEELREADRRKDEFLAMLAHELRNPLAPILTSSQMLSRLESDDSRVHRMSEIIARQATHMTGLVDELLDVARMTRGLITLDKQPLYLADAVEEAIEQARALVQERRHELDVELDDEPVQVLADRVRLIQTITNLLNNAAKYTAEGGKIQLSTSLCGAEVQVAVKDNGCGIAPPLLPHIFTLFTQGERSPDRSQGGLGLGLAVVKSLVELHGGRVSAHSEGEGQGSEFVIRLPVLSHAPAPSPPLAPTASAGGCLSVLVVDDNLDAAQSLAELLELAGYEADYVTHPLTALAHAQHGAPQVLLLDIGLPEMDGYELAGRLRALPSTCDATLIALTGYGHPQDRERAKQAGFDHYLMKPVDVDELLTLLAQLGVRSVESLAPPV